MNMRPTLTAVKGPKTDRTISVHRRAVSASAIAPAMRTFGRQGSHKVPGEWENTGQRLGEGNCCREQESALTEPPVYVEVGGSLPYIRKRLPSFGLALRRINIAPLLQRPASIRPNIPSSLAHNKFSSGLPPPPFLLYLAHL